MAVVESQLFGLLKLIYIIYHFIKGNSHTRAGQLIPPCLERGVLAANHLGTGLQRSQRTVWLAAWLTELKSFQQPVSLLNSMHNTVFPS